MKSKVFAFVSFCAILFSLGCRETNYKQGERLYLAHCANCHMEDGTGLALLIPPLAKADYLKNNQEAIPCIIRYGQKGEIVVNNVIYDQEMPGEDYTEIQINNMINYINTAWGNKIPPVTITQTKERLENCAQ